MPKHQFLDREGIQLLDPCTTIGRVVEAEMGVTSNGNDKLDIKIEALGAFIFDTLFFTQAAGWKTDVVLKACNRAPEKGIELEIDENLLIGACAKIEVGVENYLDKSGNTKKKNVIKQWLTDPKSREEAKKFEEDQPF